MATKPPQIKAGPQPSTGGRHYPVALAYLEALGVHAPDPQRPSRAAKPAPGVILKGTAKVRPGLVTGRAAQAVPQDLLEQVVDVAQVGGVGGETPSFYLSFRQDELGPVRCEVALVKGQVVATFTAQNVHTSRLLAAESQILRNLLERRGLRAAQVIVQGPQ